MLLDMVTLGHSTQEDTSSQRRLPAIDTDFDSNIVAHMGPSKVEHLATDVRVVEPDRSWTMLCQLLEDNIILSKEDGQKT